MKTAADYLRQLVQEKLRLASILRGKGVEAENSEKFNTLIDKVLEMPVGGGADEEDEMAGMKTFVIPIDKKLSIIQGRIMEQDDEYGIYC